jgi:hypothetical protein
MKFRVALGCIFLLASLKLPAQEGRVLPKLRPLPVALSDDFEFRKTKLYFLDDQLRKVKAAAKGHSSTYSGSQQSTAAAQDASIAFERPYRLFGALTKLDQHQRYGNYFDFFWRVKRPADVTVRLEYRQEKLHDFVQAQEIFYGNVHGNQRTEFKVIGDDYFDDGRVTAWRCLLIENGRIVAEKQSYLWE